MASDSLLTMLEVEYLPEDLIDQGTSIASNHFTNSPMTTSLHCTGEYEPEFTVNPIPLGGTPEWLNDDWISRGNRRPLPRQPNEAAHHPFEPRTQHTQSVMPAPPPQAPQRDHPVPPPPSKENLARDLAANKTLMDLRKARWPYKNIAQELERMYGIVASTNALSKRHTNLLKVQKEYLEPLPEAIKNVMPEIMALIRNEAVRKGLSASDMKSLDDLPEVIPNLVQNRLLRKKSA